MAAASGVSSPPPRWPRLASRLARSPHRCPLSPPRGHGPQQRLPGLALPGTARQGGRRASFPFPFPLPSLPFHFFPFPSLPFPFPPLNPPCPRCPAEALPAKGALGDPKPKPAHRPRIRKNQHRLPLVPPFTLGSVLHSPASRQEYTTASLPHRHLPSPPRSILSPTQDNTQ